MYYLFRVLRQIRLRSEKIACCRTIFAARFDSSLTCTRYFCSACGAHLALFTTLSPHTLDVTIATLDHPEQAPADRHIWTQSQLPWLQVDVHLPQEQQEHID